MTRWNRKNALRFTSATVLALAMFAAATARAQQPADLSVFEVNGTRYLAGCVTTELADRLIAEHGFQAGNGPLSILCIEGTVAVHRQLGN